VFAFDAHALAVAPAAPPLWGEWCAGGGSGGGRDVGAALQDAARAAAAATAALLRAAVASKVTRDATNAPARMGVE
jgi:hypothetical protein